MTAGCDTGATRGAATPPYTVYQQPGIDFATEECRVQASRTRRRGLSLIAGLWGERRRRLPEAGDALAVTPAPIALPRAPRVPRWLPWLLALAAVTALAVLVAVF